MNSTEDVFGSIFYNNTGATSDGIQITQDAIYRHFWFNNSSINNGRYGFNRVSSTDLVPVFDYNNYNGNGTAGLNNITAGANDTTGAPSFTDIANGDFTLSSSDTAVLGKGFPQDWTSVGLIGDYQWNIGVDQDDNTVAGGGGSTVGYGHSN